MKRTVLLITLAAMSVTVLRAQEDMAVQWEAKCDHKIENTGISDDKGFLFGSNDKEITVCKNKNGDVLWTKQFKEIAPGLNKVDEQIPMWDANVLFLFDRKMVKDKVACIDIQDGKFLWMTEKYQDVTDESVIYISE